jgi:hypothetical protein
VLGQLLLGDLDPVPLASAKRLPVGGITPFRAPRFVSSERSRMTRVSLSYHRFNGHEQVGELLQQPLGDQRAWLGTVHPSWGLLRLGGVKKRQAPDHGPSLF